MKQYIFTLLAILFFVPCPAFSKPAVDGGFIVIVGLDGFDKPSTPDDGRVSVDEMILTLKGPYSIQALDTDAGKVTAARDAKEDMDVLVIKPLPGGEPKLTPSEPTGSMMMMSCFGQQD